MVCECVCLGLLFGMVCYSLMAVFDSGLIVYLRGIGCLGVVIAFG